MEDSAYTYKNTLCGKLINVNTLKVYCRNDDHKQNQNGGCFFIIFNIMKPMNDKTFKHII